MKSYHRHYDRKTLRMIARLLRHIVDIRQYKIIVDINL